MGKKKMFMRTIRELLILDLYPFAVGYSVSRIKNGAIRPLRIRRSSDNAQTDILFNGSGSFDLGSMVEAGGTLGAWVGLNNAFVSVWYDQSGNNYNASESQSNLQPRIILNGIINLKNGLPAIDFLNTITRLRGVSALPSLNSGNNLTTYSVTNTRISNTVGVFFTTNFSNSAIRLGLICDSRVNGVNSIIQTLSGIFLALMSTPRQNTDQRINITSVNGISKYMSSWDNGVTGSQNISFTGDYVNDFFQIGAQHQDQTPLDGNIQEFLIRGFEDTTIQREAITDNINLRFTIY